MARKAPPSPPLPAWDERPAYTQAKGEFAAELAVTPGAVSHWIGRGLPVRPDGLIDQGQAARWLLDNLDPGQAHRTRAEAVFLHHYVIEREDVRRICRETVEAAAAAAHAAAVAAGLGDADAGVLADAVAGGAVERINPALTEAGNLALPPPPAGLWAVWQSDYPPAPVGLPPARQPVDLAALTLPAG